MNQADPNHEVTESALNYLKAEYPEILPHWKLTLADDKLGADSVPGAQFTVILERDTEQATLIAEGIGPSIESAIGDAIEKIRNGERNRR